MLSLQAYGGSINSIAAVVGPPGHTGMHAYAQSVYRYETDVWLGQLKDKTKGETLY